MKKLLVANRGEIAVRVMRACRELGIPSVAVYSEADADALFARYADEAYCVGPPPASRSYLDAGKLIATAKACGADAIHPGYGFLAENPAFADACAAAGIKFVGPSSRVLELMGSKVAARKVMRDAGVPVVPGTQDAVADVAEARRIAREIGYPVIVKPSGGGGGIGMTVVNDESELERAIEASQTIARATFGLADVYLEKYMGRPRHIEIQVLGDSHGNAVHLGERECSIQRRHQKVIEEAPSPALTPRLRKQMGEAAVTAVRALGYEGAGTLEFLFSDGKFYFMEMNTRVQVEHPVTEMITGVDIVKEQLRVAAGHPLSLRQRDVRMSGSAIECRINAEDPSADFAPAPGKLRDYSAPGGIGVRVDSGVYGGYTIPPFYDSMIAKLVVWGRDRAEAVARMKRALYEYVLSGTANNVAFHRAVMENPRFVAGELDTHFIERETSLLAEMARIAGAETPLGDRLPRAAGAKARIAAVAVAAAIARIHAVPS
ncbi:MAG: acetyl-CoA carboxylase biotin carboxylase subunit [Deltaproteobacteria bacterium]|nr:acetyl-CoA carboxylase biotin carboxylase subunit [Deltaproteobacteria bacterium]